MNDNEDRGEVDSIVSKIELEVILKLTLPEHNVYADFRIRIMINFMGNVLEGEYKVLQRANLYGSK